MDLEAGDLNGIDCITSASSITLDSDELAARCPLLEPNLRE